MMFRRLRRWWQNRKNPLLAASEMALQKSGALGFRRDPCGPGGCRLLQATTCANCQRRLYECESVRIGRAGAQYHNWCASCLPFDPSYKGAPDGWTINEVCSHNVPQWQKCDQCGQRPAPTPIELDA